jgi:hypothetical protein
MPVRPSTLLFVLSSSLLAGVVAREARACGGGLVSRQGTLGASAQRIFLAAGPTSTEVVTQVIVPASTDDYGVLIPLPAKPEIDPNPISAEALDALDRSTSPRVIKEDDGGGGIGCVCGGAADKAGGAPRGGVMAADPVQVGPVTAVSLTADTGEALNGWLTDNGFALPAGARPLIDEYAGPGKYLVAIKRSKEASPGSPSSVGVHFTVPGDARALPLRFAGLGAAPEVAFTLFIVAAQPSGPQLPFEGLTIDKLDRAVAGTQGYRAAVKKAVADRRGQALVIENVQDVDAIGPPSLRGLAVKVGGEVITRLSTVVASSALTQDVALTGSAPMTVPTTITVAAAGGRSAAPYLAAMLGAVAFVRPRRRREQPPVNRSRPPGSGRPG